MSDEQNHDNPVNPSDVTQPQPAVSPIDDVAGAQSRRRFLRLAVISGATVATVGATAGAVAAAHPHTGILTNLGLAGHGGSSCNTTSCTMCIEKSGFKQISDFSEKGTPELWLWFTGHNLPPAVYTLTVQQDPPASSTFPTTPFAYISGKEAKLFKYDPCKADDCPDNEGGDSHRVAHGTTIADCFPYEVKTTSADLQLNVHFQFVGPQDTHDQMYTFTGTLTKKVNGQDVFVCSSQASVTGKP